VTAANGAVPSDAPQPGDDGLAGPVAGRRYPPIAPLALSALTLAVIGGIVMASYVPRRPPVGLPLALAIVSVLALVAAGGLLARLNEFAWERFRLVFGWALLAYIISAGMIAFAFVKDHASGAPLAIVLVMLAVFALDVPVIIAFTVARYSSPPYTTQ
jgi:hypothetical protein